MNAPINYSDDELIDELTTCLNIDQAARALNVARLAVPPRETVGTRRQNHTEVNHARIFQTEGKQMKEFLDTPPANSRVDTVFNTMLKRNLGRWAEYRSYEKRTTANAIAYHIRKHITSWTEPNVDYAAVSRRKPDGTYAVWVSAVRIKENADAETE